ncbi:peroxiredoxin [Microbacterium sp. LWO12-1.2]|uniref:peroxiredoxin n=1 Tax=Microbacterium sp. LWO12-1.2 TaxID=3135261 RepID=UPI00344761BE
MTQDSSGRLIGRRMPTTALTTTDGDRVDLSDPALGAFALFIYPRTGDPNKPDDASWAAIPGAKGCTVEACAIRDLYSAFRELGLGVYGLSTQSTEYQSEAVERLHLPYPILSDPSLALRRLGLDTFRFDGEELYTRVTLLVAGGSVVDVVWPTSNTIAHVSDVLASARSAYGSAG